MNVVATLFVFTMAVSIGLTVLMARRYRWRWGHRQAEVQPGQQAGPFRSGPPAAKYELSGVPFAKKLLSVLSILWGLATGLFFAPAGAVFLLMAADSATGPIEIVGTLGVLAVVISGFGLAVALCRASRATLARDAARLRGTAKWSAIHHLGVIASFAAFQDAGIFTFAVIPCLWGLAHAFWLHQTALSQESAEEHIPLARVHTLA